RVAVEQQVEREQRGERDGEELQAPAVLRAGVAIDLLEADEPGDGEQRLDRERELRAWAEEVGGDRDGGERGDEREREAPRALERIVVGRRRGGAAEQLQQQHDPGEGACGLEQARRRQRGRPGNERER